MMKYSPKKSAQTENSSTELESVLCALSAFAKSINFDTRNGESKSVRGLQNFCSEVNALQIDAASRDLLWELVFSLSNFQAKARNKLKIKTIKERNESMRNWGAFAILTVALFLVVVMFLFG